MSQPPKTVDVATALEQHAELMLAQGRSDWALLQVRGMAGERAGRLVEALADYRLVLELSPADSLLVVIGVREDGQKVLLAIKQMGLESTEAWRTVLDDLVKRGLQRPELLIVDGGVISSRTLRSACMRRSPTTTTK